MTRPLQSTATDYVKLLERITGTWCWGQSENEADCVALRQLAVLLQEITPGRVFGIRMGISGGHYAAGHDGPSLECPDEVCTEMTALYNALAALAATPENPK